MLFGKKTKENIANAVRRGKTITNTHEEEIKQVEHKQKVIDEENDDLLEKIISNEKEMWNNQMNTRQDVDRILDHLGMEKNTNTELMVPFTSGSQAQITTVLDDNLNRYNILSNVSQIVIDEKLKYAIADLLSVTTEKAMNEKFHNSLSDLEKCGILSEEKYNTHVKNVEMTKGLVNIGANIVFDVAPLIYDYCSTRIQKKNIKKFIIGSVAYINRELNPLISKHIWENLMQAKIVKNGTEIDVNFLNREFAKFANPNGIYVIPMLDDRVNIDSMQKEIMAKKIVSICDLNNNETKERALEFLESFIHIDYQGAKLILDDAGCSQQFLSELIEYSSVNYRTFFSDFIKDVGHARRFAEYDLSNDVQKKIRDKRKDSMEQIICDTMNKKGMLFTAGKRADLIKAHARVMSASLNDGFEIETALKLSKRNRKVGEYLGLL